MTPPPPGTPWWAWLIALVAVALITTGGTVLANRPMRKKLEAVAADAREARDQTANTHDTNLRDDLDAFRNEVRRGFEDVSSEQGEVRRSVGIARREIRGVRKDVGSLQEDVVEVRDETRTVRERLDEHLSSGT
ncbi:DUF2746 domain-containing protein [Cellulosimicrobium sp. JZ28]|uniref:DUF2746 domain-containing protein n=1 Tax=Cellulosimicrobium sp. JZ28 TaxID=1906273 RepID=UPI00188D5D89|nr:DUF2746 domain-containing protein [Cellulosimicrobium sp. JZ28]